MTRRKHIHSWPLFLWPLLLGLVVVVLDQWSKAEILNYFSNPHGILTVAPFFNLVFVLNRGVSFGILDEAPWLSDLFAIVAIAVVIVLLLWLARIKTALSAVALGLLIGGAIGNIIDRLRLGSVVDFLDFHLDHWHWPSFNIADSAVVTGVALLLLQSLVFDKKNRHPS